MQEAETAVQSAGEAQAALRVEVGTLTEQRQAIARDLGRLESQAADAERRRDEHARHATEADQRSERYQLAVKEAADGAEQAATEIERASGEVETARAAVHDAATAAEKVAAEGAGVRDRAREADTNWNNAEMARREAEVKREALEERTADDLRIDLAAEYGDYLAVIEPGDLEPVDIQGANTQIKELRREIKKLGNVNLDAIDEEGTLAEKNEDLAAQVADIDAATQQLGQLIEQLNLASRDRFGDVFERIREHFGGRDGMFRRLFGGGRAEVRLMPLIKEVEGDDGVVRKVETDQTDLLESGIEVIAKPPGKEPRSISQLSGGEKTLTAVALLMSIFRSKPSCFCVLDEVDAALDEANVGRYCAAVRSFTDQSRFIVITHNKRTMQMCDHLYGVTQRERGVSSRVSVKFEQVGRDGEISQDAQSPAAPAGETDAGVEETSRKPHSKNKKGRDVLRRALAGMRPETPAVVSSEVVSSE